MTFEEKDIGCLLRAIRFASEKHRLQSRKDAEKTPYINHPIAVAELLWEVGGIRDIDIIIAALLHDTIEDTSTTAEEISQNFGEKVCGWVKEVSDDKTLSKQERKRLQILNAPHKSKEAKQIKLADKICNIRDVGLNKPYGWNLERRQEYVSWAEQVIDGLRGVNISLEKTFDESVIKVKEILKDK